jgi:hypothetical protein
LVVSFDKNSGNDYKKCPLRAIWSVKMNIKIYEEGGREAREEIHRSWEVFFTFPLLFSILDKFKFRIIPERAL